MAILIKSNNYAVPKPASLNMRGIQTDQYGTVLGGHKAIIDPIQSGLTGIPAPDDVVENLIANSENGIVVDPYQEAVSAVKGYGLTNSESNGSERIDLPSSFNLLNIDEKPSCVVSFWLTTRTVPTGFDGVIGCAYQTGGKSQWYLSGNNNGNSFRFGVSGGNLFYITPALNTPELITLVIKKSDENEFSADLYQDDSHIGTKSLNYPLVDPGDSAATNSGIPRIGQLNGFTNAFDGIVHRAQVFEIDPATFDAEQWIADEIANNATRFVLP